MQSLVGIESLKKFFMMKEYSVEENVNTIRFIANRLLSKLWLDYYRNELSYH